MTKRLAPSGTPVIVVSADSLTADDRATLRARGGTFPVYTDVGHRAQQAFSNFGTPAFYVLDEAGRVRFEWAPPQDIIRDLSVLGPAPVSAGR